MEEDLARTSLLILSPVIDWAELYEKTSIYHRFSFFSSNFSFPFFFLQLKNGLVLLSGTFVGRILANRNGD
jgi:hypothetical protein